jgi:hypothetical protein
MDYCCFKCSQCVCVWDQNHLLAAEIISSFWPLRFVLRVPHVAYAGITEDCVSPRLAACLFWDGCLLHIPYCCLGRCSLLIQFPSHFIVATAKERPDSRGYCMGLRRILCSPYRQRKGEDDKAWDRQIKRKIAKNRGKELQTVFSTVWREKKMLPWTRN